MFTWKFWKQTLERMIRTFAAGMLSVLEVPQILDVRHVGWLDAISISAGASAVTLLFCIVGSSVGNDKESPSMVDTE
jgi:hypothetical protein